MADKNTINKIDDSELDGVAGGAVRRENTVCCPYCRHPKSLRRTGREQVFYDGNLYYEWYCSDCDHKFWNQNNCLSLD